MNKKQEAKRIKELRKLNRGALEKRRQEFIDDQRDVLRAIRLEQQNHSDLIMNLDSATKSKDASTATVIEGRLKVSERHLEYLTKRERALTEEIELIGKALKAEDDSSANKWMTIGSWVIGGAGLGLSGIGLYKSHKAFNDGSMVDKGTKSMAEKINPLNLFKAFGKK